MDYEDLSAPLRAVGAPPTSAPSLTKHRLDSLSALPFAETSPFTPKRKREGYLLSLP